MLLALYSIMGIVLSLKLNNIFTGFFLTAIFTLPFFNPNKYYTLEVIRTQNFIRGIKIEYLLGYGINLANIMFLIAGIGALRNVVLHNTIFLLGKFRFILPVFLVVIGFYLLNLITSVYISPFPIASIVWLVQYMQLYVIALFTLYVFICDRKHFTTIYSVLIALISLQVILSLWQFMKQSSVGLPIEYVRGTFFAMGLDENNALYRVSGTLLFSNQLAFVLALLLTIILPFGFKTKNVFILLIGVLSIITVVLTQSRSIWLALCLLSFFSYAVYIKDATWLFRLIDRKRLFVYGLILFIGLSIIIIPRIILSANAGYEGAGIPVRIKMIAEGLEALSQSPWFGYGIGTNEYVLFKLFPNGVMSTFPAAVHQAFVQILLEVGIIGVLLFVLPFIYILRLILVQILPPVHKTATSYSLTFLAGMCVCFIYYLFQPHVGIVEFPFIGIILGFGLIDVYLKYFKNEKN